jgi:hypothetical protein
VGELLLLALALALLRQRELGARHLAHPLLLEPQDGALVGRQRVVLLPEPPVDEGVGLAQLLVLHQQRLLALQQRRGNAAGGGR